MSGDRVCDRSGAARTGVEKHTEIHELAAAARGFDRPMPPVFRGLGPSDAAGAPRPARRGLRPQPHADRGVVCVAAVARAAATRAPKAIAPGLSAPAIPRHCPVWLWWHELPPWERQGERAGAFSPSHTDSAGTRGAPVLPTLLSVSTARSMPTLPKRAISPATTLKKTDFRATCSPEVQSVDVEAAGAA